MMTASDVSPHLPVVLVLAGHDPTGGAGLVADAEAIAACGGWALTVPTALTVQNCRDVAEVLPCDPDAIRAMALALEGFEIAAIKVGLVTDTAVLDAVSDIVRRYPGVPLVVDPVLKAGGGSELSTAELVDAFRERLLPLVDILTPNRLELQRLAGTTEGDDTERAVELMTLGCQAVLVTGDNGVEHYNETDTMRDYLVDAGIPRDRVVGDHAGFSTWDSCARAKEVFGVEEATVLTQEFHLPRAVRLCRAAGIDTVGVGGDSMGERGLATVYGWAREVPAAVAALGKVVFRPDPRFLGDYETGVDDALAAHAEETR